MYYLVGSFLRKFQMQTFHFTLYATFSIGFWHGLAAPRVGGSHSLPAELKAVIAAAYGFIKPRLFRDRHPRPHQRGAATVPTGGNLKVRFEPRPATGPV